MILQIERHIAMEISFPAVAYLFMVHHHEVHNVCQIVFSESAAVACKLAASVPSKSYLRGACRWLSLRYVNVHGLPVLTRPKIDGKALEQIQPRHMILTPPERGAESGARCCERRNRDMPYRRR